MNEYAMGNMGYESGQAAYLRNVEILVAEDNEFARILLRNGLRAFGANCVQYAKDGSDALHALRSFDIDIALVDWHMPVIDGIELTRLIRNTKDTGRQFLPIIMMTSYAEQHHILQARDAGVNEYLIKPFSAKQLLKRLQTVIESPRRFVQTDNYFGPDRRRKKGGKYKGPDRRKKDEAQAPG